MHPEPDDGDDRPGRPGGADFGIDDLYDADTLAVLDGWKVNGLAPASAQSRVASWSRRTAMGMVLTGVALGLQEVLDPAEQRPIVIEVDDIGEPRHLPVELFLDPDSPAGSLCLVHRDLLPTPTV